MKLELKLSKEEQDLFYNTNRILTEVIDDLSNASTLMEQGRFFDAMKIILFCKNQTKSNTENILKIVKILQEKQVW